MQKVIFTKGLQASGKTSWATKFVEEHQDYKRVNRDSIRHMLSNYTFNDENEKIVTKIENEMIKSLLGQEYNLVMDNMNLNEKNRNKQIQFMKSIIPDIQLEIKKFPITLAEAIERDSKREFPIGKSVLKKTWNRYEIELKNMIERARPKYIEDQSLPHCMCTDLDGTLSNSLNRGIYNGNEIEKDLVIKPVRDLIEVFKDKLRIIILSGRSDEWKDATVKWLKNNNVYFDEIHMRRAEDNRCDTIVKNEMFEEHVRNRYYCEFVVDDRVKVLDTWQKKGLFTFDVRQDAYCKNNF